MKRTALFLTAFFLFTLSLPAQQPISQQLNSFSPLAQVYLKHLGLTDKNSNGIIDKDEGEGYEAFTATYGNADMGFPANGVTYGITNGKLEEPEIINSYYINIRFKPEFETETTAIENEVKAFVYANNLPLVWLDDQQGTVMTAVNKILGEGWQEQKVTEDEAVKLFTKVMDELRIYARQGKPSNSGGYYTLAEFVTKKSGYCFEVAQFGFWFFSELKINSVCAEAYLTSTTLHEVVKLSSGKIVDYFKSGAKHKTPNSRWATMNPLQDIGIYYATSADNTNDSVALEEQAVLIDKYNLSHITNLMYTEHSYYTPNYEKIICLGGFLLGNIDIPQLMQAKHLDATRVRNKLRSALLILGVAYQKTKNRTELTHIQEILTKYYKSDKAARQILELEIY